MSNPHTRGQYPYQNEAERSRDPAGNISDPAINRMSHMQRAAAGVRPMAQESIYPPAPEPQHLQDGVPPSNYAQHARGFNARRDSGSAGPHGDLRYEPVRPAYGAWEEPAVTHRIADAGSGQNWPEAERGKVSDHWQRSSHHAVPAQESTAYGGEPAVTVRALPVRERRGPKNYVRSDERIRDELCERMVRDPRLEVGEVSVEVQDGRVLLSGTVPERRMKHAVEDIADDCWGVTDIDNRLRVMRVEIDGDSPPSVWRNRTSMET